MISWRRMYKVLRRLAGWDDERIRKLEKLLDADEAKAAVNLAALLSTPEFDKKFKKSVSSGSLDVLIERVIKHRSEQRLVRMRSLSLAEEASFLPEARIENLAADPSRIVVGKGTHLRGELLVFRFGGMLSIGQYGYLGENSRVWAGERVAIGSHVLISHDVFITDCNAHELDPTERAAGFRHLVTTGHPIEKGGIVTAPVIIHDHVWINPQCIILPGVTIGEGSIIGAGSVVVRDIPANVLAVGNPARVVRSLS